MNLDYSSLQQAITPTDILQLKQWKKHQKNSRLNVSGTLVSIIVGTLLMVIVVSSAAQHMPPLLAVAIGGGIAVVATGSMLLFQRHQLRKEAVLYRFATANALLLSLDAAPTDHHGVIFTQGHSQRISAAYTAADGTQIGNYHYTTGSGKNRRDHHWKFVRIKLVRRLPHMVLDAKSNNFFGKLSNLPAGFHGQALSLEGNFDNYFTLYAPKEYERDALYVFTPDVMATVIDLGSAYDMEVSTTVSFCMQAARFDSTKHPILCRSQASSLPSVTN